ncbi:urate hydroxylase PuuD, partial [Salmonella enterica]|uniref:urate hydroxylase PuuD n=1 Tax=Salmonella enterica TaxID=28901 RepID=UPI003FA6C01A
HYGWVSDHPHNWLVLLLMMLAGAAIRQFFVLRHGHRLGHRRHPWPYALAGALLLLGVAGWLRPVPVPTAQAPTAVPSATAVQQVLAQRCTGCHGEVV